MCSRRSANPSTRRWRDLRARKLQVSPICELRMLGCETTAVQVDHIKQLKHGGDRWAWDNLRSVCDACHKKRHGKRKRYGSDANGMPLDPEHPWNRQP